MNEVLKKIDEMIRDCHRAGGCSVLHDAINLEKAKVLREVKGLILAEQKEPCTDSKICLKCNHLMSYDSYFKKMVCHQCGHMEETEIKPLTKGDKIRESNESLAKFIFNSKNSCDYCLANDNSNTIKCMGKGCTAWILDYLNQPQEGE